MPRRPKVPIAARAAVPLCLVAVLAGCGGSDAGTPADPQEAVCAWLDEELAELATAGSNLGAQTVFADDWSSWAAEDPSRPQTAAELDRLSTEGCEQTRTRALTALGTESFADILG